MEKRIEKWLNKGLIDKQTAINLLTDIKQEKEASAKIKTNIAIYTIAIILIGLSVISFIAANDWLAEILNKCYILKIIALLALSIGSLLSGYNFAYKSKKLPRLGSALILLSSILIGATYILVGQIYNFNANNSMLMLIWLISIVPLAYTFKNYAINIVSIIMFILMTIYFYANQYMFGTISCILIGAGLYSASNIPVVQEKYHNFCMSYKVTGLMFIFFALMILSLGVNKPFRDYSVCLIAPLIFLIVFNFINYICNKVRSVLLKVETCYLIALLSMILLILIDPDHIRKITLILSNIAIIFIIYNSFKFGYEKQNNAIVTSANWMLILYLTLDYFRWLFDYMNKSLLFLLGGVSLLTLGLFLENKKKEIIGKENNFEKSNI